MGCTEAKKKHVCSLRLSDVWSGSCKVDLGAVLGRFGLPPDLPGQRSCFQAESRLDSNFENLKIGYLAGRGPVGGQIPSESVVREPDFVVREPDFEQGVIIIA